MPSEEIFDKFGCRLKVGDGILYVPMGGTEHYPLKWGVIESFQNLNFLGRNRTPNWYINIVGEGDGFTSPHKCVRFSKEEVTMRKLESGI